MRQIKLRAAIHVLLVSLFVSFTMLAAQQISAVQSSKTGEGSIQDAVGDPIGDQQGTDLDLQVVNAFTNGDSLTIELIADQEILPPIQGGIFIDTDQNASTGNSDVVGILCPSGSVATGFEFAIGLLECTTTSCAILDDQPVDTGAYATAEFNGNRAVFTAALSDIGGDDGITDIEVALGVSSPLDCGPGVRSVESNASMTADYPFDGNLSSRTLNAPDATETRSGSAFTTESVLGTTRPVRTFNAGNGLRIDPTSGLISDSVYTIQMLVRIDEIPGSILKLLDFSDLSDEPGLYVTSIGRLFFNIDPGSVSGPENSFPVDAWTQVVLTRDIGGTVKGYIDGVEQFDFADASFDAAALSGALVFLDDDPVSFGNNNSVSAGAIACLRIHPTALDGPAVAELDCEPLRVGLNGNACAFSTINEAVAAAQSGDEVFIEVGSYNERIGQISGKNLTLRAATSSSNCTEPESAFSGNRAVVDGTGFSTFSGIGGLLDIRDSSVSLVAVDLTNGATGQGGLVYVRPGSSFSTEGSTLSNGSVSSDRINPGIPSDTDEPAGGCVYAEGAAVSFTLTTFTNCRVIGPNNGADPANGDGGAIHARAGSTISGGLAVSLGDNSGRDGGAIMLVDSTADLSEILFFDNAATRNGGAFAAIDSPVTLGFNSTFSENVAGASGGAISLIRQTLDVTDAALFEGNSANERGGAINVEGGDLRIRPSTDSFFPSRFDSNTALLTGGAIYIFENSNDLPNPTIQGIEFVNNSTDARGGALSLLNATNIEVVDSSFTGNSSNALGGAVYSQASTSTFRSSDSCKAFRFADPNEYCSQFLNNDAAEFGSAIAYLADNVASQVLTTAFVDNAAPNTVQLANPGNDVSMESVWFYDNLGDAVVASDDAIFRVAHGTFHSNAGSAFVGSDTSSLTMLNSIAFGNAGGGVTSMGTGNVNVFCNLDQSNMVGPNIDPMFVNDGDGESHLDLLSPAVNACPEEATLAVDLEGRPRTQGPAPDMGAFETTDVLFEDGFEQPATR